MWLQHAKNDVDRKWIRAGAEERIDMYIYYTGTYDMITSIKHILRHVKQHKEPAL